MNLNVGDFVKYKDLEDVYVITRKMKRPKNCILDKEFFIINVSKSQDLRREFACFEYDLKLTEVKITQK